MSVVRILLEEKQGEKKRGIVIYDLLYEIVIYNRLADQSRVIVSILLSLSLSLFFSSLFCFSFRHAFSGLRVFENEGRKLWKAFVRSFFYRGNWKNGENRGRGKFDKRVWFFKGQAFSLKKEEKSFLEIFQARIFPRKRVSSRISRFYSCEAKNSFLLFEREREKKRVEKKKERGGKARYLRVFFSTGWT